MKRHLQRAPRWLRWLTLAAATAALTVATLRLGASLAEPPPLPVLDHVGGGFQLPSTRGGELALDDLRGEIVLLNFGFTDCPDVCPTVLARLRATLLDLQRVGVAARPLFVTLDPARDSLSRLEKYLGHFHPDLIGLRGSPEVLERVAERYRVFFERVPLADGDYTVDHSAHVYLIDRGGRVRAMFGPGVSVPAMVEHVRRLHGESQRPEPQS